MGTPTKVANGTRDSLVLSTRHPKNLPMSPKYPNCFLFLHLFSHENQRVCDVCPLFFKRQLRKGWSKQNIMFKLLKGMALKQSPYVWEHPAKHQIQQKDMDHPTCLQQTSLHPPPSVANWPQQMLLGTVAWTMKPLVHDWILISWLDMILVWVAISTCLKYRLNNQSFDLGSPGPKQSCKLH